MQTSSVNNASTPALQGVYLNISMADWSLLKELIQRFGWQSETREQLLDRFIATRPQTPALSEDEIMAEVHAARHGL